MAKIISVVNQKGGVGKTTSAVNLVAALGAMGKKILLVDIDPQGNTTSGYGISRKNLAATSYEILIGTSTAREAVIKTKFQGVDIIPSNINLAGAELELVDMQSRESRIRSALAPVKDRYDFIFIDCPPSLSLLTVNAMTAADSVLVPIQCEYYALEGLSQLIHTIELVKERLNPNLDIEGVVFTMYDARTNLSLQVVENVKSNLKQNVYKTIIPRNIRLAEAPSHGMPINVYDSKSTGAESYRLLAEEVIHRGEDEWL